MLVRRKLETAVWSGESSFRAYSSSSWPLLPGREYKESDEGRVGCMDGGFLAFLLPSELGADAGAREVLKAVRVVIGSLG